LEAVNPSGEFPQLMIKTPAKSIKNIMNSCKKTNKFIGFFSARPAPLKNLFDQPLFLSLEKGVFNFYLPFINYFI
jgi:hypothetical protein